MRVLEYVVRVLELVCVLWNYVMRVVLEFYDVKCQLTVYVLCPYLVVLVSR